MSSSQNSNYQKVTRTLLEDMSPSAISLTEISTIADTNSYFEKSKGSYIEQNGASNPKHTIGAALNDKITTINHETCEAGDEDTFFVADLGEVYRQQMRWKQNLPRVKPFYGEFYPFL
jgi:ornithine decarboxylase